MISLSNNMQPFFEGDGGDKQMVVIILLGILILILLN